MENLEPQNESNETPLRLRWAIVMYLVSCLILYVLFMLNMSGGIIFLVYLALGVALNHLVLKRLIEWHPMYNTIGNVANAKLKAVLFWPLSYLFLFAQLIINKVL